MTTQPSQPTADVTVGLEALTIADAMRAFADSGLIDLLERLQPISGTHLALRAHVSTRALSLLLEVLAEAGVVRRGPLETWQLTSTAYEWTGLIGSLGCGTLYRGRRWS